MLSQGSKGVGPVLLFLEAFLAAFALAMLSRKALDDFVTLRTSASGSMVCSEPFDEFLDVIDDGEVIFDEIFEGGCLVFLTVIRDGLVSFSAGLTKPDDKESRGFGFVASVAPVRVSLKGRES